jgi:Uncharacterized protein conserved in bacteria
MPAFVDILIAGRTYQVACREGEEEHLRSAARLVDGKSREALAGLGTLSETRQFLFAALLLADELVDKDPDAAPLPARTSEPDSRARRPRRTARETPRITCRCP